MVHISPLFFFFFGVITLQVVIGCDGVNSVVADFLGLKPPRVSPTSNVRGFTNYPSGHGFSPEFVRINEDHVFLGRIPLNDKLVYWFIARPRTPQGNPNYYFLSWFL